MNLGIAAPGLKSQLHCALRGISFSGDKSETCVAAQFSFANGIPFKGDRSDTGVPPQSSAVNDIPLSGDRSDTRVLLHSRFVKGMPLSGDRSDTLVSLQIKTRQRQASQGRRGPASFPLPRPLPAQLGFVSPAQAPYRREIESSRSVRSVNSVHDSILDS